MIRLMSLALATVLTLAFGTADAKADAGKLYYPGEGGTTCMR